MNNHEKIILGLSYFTYSMEDGVTVPSEYKELVTMLHTEFEIFIENNFSELFVLSEKLYEAGYVNKDDIANAMYASCTIEGVEEHVRNTVDAFLSGQDISMACCPIFIHMMTDKLIKKTSQSNTKEKQAN